MRSRVAVLMLADGGAVTASLWPDVIVGAAIAFLFVRTAWTVLNESIRDYRTFKPGLISSP